MRDPRLTKLADVLVNYSVGVQPGQLVRIHGPLAGEALAIEIFRAAVIAGGNPFIQFSADEAAEILLKHGSDEQLKFMNPVQMFITEKADCSIGMWAETNTRALSNCDAKRMGLLQSARKPMMERGMQRAADGSFKWVGTQFPTNAAAQFHSKKV